MAKTSTGGPSKTASKTSSRSSTAKSGTASRRNMSPKSSHKQTLDAFKNEVANSMNINLKQGGSLTAQQAGKVGGEMVKRMISYAAQNMKKS